MGKNKTLQFVMHLIGWGILFCFPLFFTSKNSEVMTPERYLGYVFVPVTFMIVFYSNYFLFIDRILFKKQLFRFLLANLLLFLLLSLSLNWWREYYIANILAETIHRPPNGPPKMIFILRDGMMMMLTAALSVAIKMTENWYVIQGEKKELEKARTEAELQNLKSQLNPHFLFNTLNNIYSLIAIDSDRAQYAIHALSRLLRHVLYEEKQQYVSFCHELEFMRSYIELMSLRLSDKVQLKIELPSVCGEFKVAPLLFITLIENAFKHGVHPTQASFIGITLKTTEEGDISCRIENSDYPKNDEDCSGSGIGLRNLHKRLELLYAGCYCFETIRENGRYITTLNLQTKDHDTQLPDCR